MFVVHRHVRRCSNNACPCAQEGNAWLAVLVGIVQLGAGGSTDAGSLVPIMQVARAEDQASTARKYEAVGDKMRQRWVWWWWCRWWWW